MKPKPLNLQCLDGDDRFTQDAATGLVWHRTGYRVLYADTDRSGAVYHSNHLKFFELGRATLMRDVNHPYREVEESGYLYPVVKTGVNYYRFLSYDDPIWILTRPSRLERVRIRFDYLIVKSGESEITADGFTLHCALNQKHVPVAVDPATVKVWRHFLP